MFVLHKIILFFERKRTKQKLWIDKNLEILNLFVFITNESKLVISKLSIFFPAFIHLCKN